ncbi:MAG: hypothetical protein JXC32_14550 [Anaerolineae bacterium]|nr:hypothetical protein [Anaerolineae bacterium]
MSHTEFDSLDAAKQYLRSEARYTIECEMRGVGCREFAIEVWDASPVVPEPLRPG